MPLVHLIATGGTIASTATGGGYRASASGADLLARIGRPPDCELRVTDSDTLGSFAWRRGDLVALLRRISWALDDGADGVVVTHGTDTMEEVALLAALAHDDPRPVVFTGAQRPFDHPAADGPQNLADALRVAASPVARDRGALVVFDGWAFPARGVTKVDTASTHAFAAPGRGPALRITWRGVAPLTAPGRPRPLPIGSELPRVDVLPLYVGVDADLARAAVAAGAVGLVLAAFGAGNANPDIVDMVREIVATGVPVLVCSRVPSGFVHPIYTGGGGADLAEAGALFGADLSPWQGRILLMAALSGGRERAAHVVERWLEGT
jgi:L-asparaginase